MWISVFFNILQFFQGSILMKQNSIFHFFFIFLCVFSFCFCFFKKSVYSHKLLIIACVVFSLRLQFGRNINIQKIWQIVLTTLNIMRTVSITRSILKKRVHIIMTWIHHGFKTMTMPFIMKKEKIKTALIRVNLAREIFKMKLYTSIICRSIKPVTLMVVNSPLTKKSSRITLECSTLADCMIKSGI